MGLDIRIPIGAMFGTLGSLLVVYGLITANDTHAYARSFFININLWWGAVMLVFGLTMLYFGRRSRNASVHLAQESIEGRAIEEREHHAGLEHE